jgi:hypothetical protein
MGEVGNFHRADWPQDLVGRLLDLGWRLLDHMLEPGALESRHLNSTIRPFEVMHNCRHALHVFELLHRFPRLALPVLQQLLGIKRRLVEAALLFALALHLLETALCLCDILLDLRHVGQSLRPRSLLMRLCLIRGRGFRKGTESRHVRCCEWSSGRVVATVSLGTSGMSGVVS